MTLNNLNPVLTLPHPPMAEDTDWAEFLVKELQFLKMICHTRPATDPSDFACTRMTAQRAPHPHKRGEQALQNALRLHLKLEH